MVDPYVGVTYNHLMHHTKEKGDLGVLKAQVDLHQQGFTILNPITEHAPFDLAIYKSQKFWRVQIKYRALDKNGVLGIHLRSCWSDKYGTHMQSINKDEIDLYCVYCPDTDECYYFDPKDVNASVTLRVEAPKNNQKRHVKMASDYRRVP